MLKPTCENCRFFEVLEPNEEFAGGECRKHAPQAAMRIQEAAYWPVVFACDWCGEFASLENGDATCEN